MQVENDQLEKNIRELTVTDRNSNKVIHSANYNQPPVEIVSKVPESLYQVIDVLWNESNDNKITLSRDLTYLHVWPCEKESMVTLIVNSRSGSAEEVRQMWDSKPMIKPSDTKAAAIYYANSMGTALARIDIDPNSKHQYDLISSYLVLRAFKVYSQISRVPLIPSPQLRMIADRLLGQLDTINVEDLEVIVKEGPLLASEVLYYQIFYKKIWDHILSKLDKKEKLILMRKFYDSITSERDSALILKALRLTSSEILASRNSLLGEYVLDSNRELKTLGELLDIHISETQLHLEKIENVSNREKLTKDLSYFKQLSFDSF